MWSEFLVQKEELPEPSTLSLVILLGLVLLLFVVKVRDIRVGKRDYGRGFFESLKNPPDKYAWQSITIIAVGFVVAILFGVGGF